MQRQFDMDLTTQNTERQLIDNQIARKKNMKKQKQTGSITNQDYQKYLQMDKEMIKERYQTRQQDSKYREKFFPTPQQKYQNYTIKQDEPNQQQRFKNHAKNMEKPLYKYINRSTFNWKILYLQLQNNIYTKTRQAKITSKPQKKNYSYSYTVKTQNRYTIFGISARLLMKGVYDFTVRLTKRKYLNNSQLRKYVIMFEGPPMAVRSELEGVTVLGNNILAVIIQKQLEKRQGGRQLIDEFIRQFSNELALTEMEKLDQDSQCNLYIIKTLENLKQIIQRARIIVGSHHRMIQIFRFPRYITVEYFLQANIRASIQFEDIRRKVYFPDRFRLVIQFEDHYECIRAYNQVKQYGNTIGIDLADEQQKLIGFLHPLLIRCLKLKL